MKKKQKEKNEGGPKEYLFMNNAGRVAVGVPFQYMTDSVSVMDEIQGVSVALYSKVPDGWSMQVEEDGLWHSIPHKVAQELIPLGEL